MFRDGGNVNLIANFAGLELPQGGPNFVKFGDDVLYEIHVDNNGDVVPDITYQFRFRSTVGNPNSFLYNTGQVTSPSDPDLNVKQTYSVKRIKNGVETMLATDVLTPPVNVGPRSTPNYEAALATPAIGTLAGGAGKVFSGQREDPFFADLGSIFDLLALRPIQSNHVIGTPTNTNGVDGLKGLNVHTIALQVPIGDLTSDGTTPTTVDRKASVIGAYASASRQRVKVLSLDGGSAPRNAGRFVQVSRLGIPLVNEVLIPLGSKDKWNSTFPKDDAQFFGPILDPEPTRLLPVVYPSVFKAQGQPGANTPGGGAANRPDLIQLLTGQLSGLSAANALPPADLLRLNVAVAPVTGTDANRLGALQGDAAGFPNGRRLTDDVVDIELQVLAGVLLPGFGNGNPANPIPGTGVPYSALADGVDRDEGGASNTVTPLVTFPYVAPPFSGYSGSQNTGTP